MSRLVLVLLGIVPFVDAAGADDGKPNIVLIAVDDLNDWIGPNGEEGNAQAITPNLDRLARRGVYFTNAHTAVPVCMASRLALMSGMSAASTGHYANDPIAPSSRLRQAVMLPAYLRMHGYKTMGGGKLYHHGTDSKTDSPDWDLVKPMYEMSKEWRQRGHNYGQNFFQPFPKGGSQIVRQHGNVPGFSLCGGPLDREDMPRGIMPDGRNAGSRCARPVSLLDVYPTIVDLLGLPPLETHEGMSLVPWLTDVSAPRERPAVTTWHYDNHSVRSDRYRYIRYRDGSEELYDHANDPGEHVNLAHRAEFADTLAAHRRWLPKLNVSHAQDPSADALGKGYQRWSEDESQVPDWLK